jgi:hypothetical protein
MVVVMIVIMVMIMMVIVIMVMIMVMMIVVLAVMMQVGGHDTRQADRVMWMVVAVTAAIVSCGRNRGKRHSAETGHSGSSAGD